jgi:hypothetical protein
MNTVFSEFISGFDVANHRAALASYARLRGVRAADDGAELRLLAADGSVGVASFDDLNRLVGFEVEIRPSGSSN